MDRHAVVAVVEAEEEVVVVVNRCCMVVFVDFVVEEAHKLVAGGP